MWVVKLEFVGPQLDDGMGLCVALWRLAAVDAVSDRYNRSIEASLNMMMTVKIIKRSSGKRTVSIVNRCCGMFWRIEGLNLVNRIHKVGSAQ